MNWKRIFKTAIFNQTSSILLLDGLFVLSCFKYSESLVFDVSEFWDVFLCSKGIRFIFEKRRNKYNILYERTLP